MRLIDADALSATMARYIEENRNASDLFLNGCADGAYHYQFAVDHAQTIEERKTGKWVLAHPLQENDGGAYVCSCCKSGSYEVIPKTWKACPWCTALMEGDE